MKGIDPEKKLSDIVMFGGDLNVKLGENILKVHNPKLKLCAVLNIQCHYYSRMCLKQPFFPNYFFPQGLIIFFVLVYITSLIPYLNQNIKSFTIYYFLVQIILIQLGISWESTETCRDKKFFNIKSCLHN